MAQFQRMDAHLDTLSDELCQVNTRVGRIARCQAEMGGYTMPSTPVASANKSDANDATASDDEDDGNASSPSDEKMSTWHSYPLSLVTKGGVVLVMRVVILRGRASIGDFARGKVHIKGCSEDYLYFFFLFFTLDIFILVP